MATLTESYEVIGRVLAKLVLSGLRRQGLEADHVMTDLNTEKRHHFVDVVSWLHAEGLITSQAAFVNGGYAGVQLTSKGIAAVEKGTFDGNSIRETVEAKPEGGLSSDTYSKIGALVGGWMGAIIQTAQ